MIIECSQCGERICFAEPVPYGRVYTCKSCRSVLVLAKEPVPVPSAKKKLFKNGRHLAVMLVISFLLLTNLAPTVASANPGCSPETPLEGILAVLAGAQTDSETLLENVQALVAQYERKVISQSLQYMRIMEELQEVPPVTEPTNDMAAFPSAAHPLFPDYLEWQYSQFSYTVDELGTVNISPETSESLISVSRLVQ